MFYLYLLSLKIRSKDKTEFKDLQDNVQNI